jgi:Spy/CpxP family protein refolding chaperone
MKHPAPLILLAAAVLAAAIPVLAQDAPAAPARQTVRENLSTLRLLRMTEALDLTDVQTAKIYPFLTRVEKDKFKIQRAMSEDLKALRGLIRDPAAKEADVLALARSVLDARIKVRALDDEADQFLEKQLSAAQMGRYVIFQLDFYRGLENTFEQIRQRRGQMGPPPIKK